MSAFDLNASFEKAAARLGDPARAKGRRARSDRGSTRVSPKAVSLLVRLLSGQERPHMAEVMRALDDGCRKLGVRMPSRATVYALVDRLPTPLLRMGDLPVAVRAALYNLDPASEVPSHQVAFYCFNYGDLEAASFAAGLPWLALHQARKLRGFRAKSRGLLEAVALTRGI